MIARRASIDALRGLAVVLMVIDHLGLFTGQSLLRETLGRVAMPLFFIVAGSLLRTASALPRRLTVAGLGVLLPLFVPWIDSPNVLWLYGVGSTLVILMMRMGLPTWPAMAVGLTFGANGFGPHAHTYEPMAVLGLIALGVQLGPDTIAAVGDRLRGRAILEPLGRHSLGFYVGHLLVLELVRRWIQYETQQLRYLPDAGAVLGMMTLFGLIGAGALAVLGTGLWSRDRQGGGR